MTHLARRWHARIPWLSACVAALLLSGFLIDSAYAADTCSARDPIRALLLIDRSTTFDSIAENNLREGSLRLFDSLCTDDKLTVYSIAGELIESEELFDEKIPGCNGIALMCNTTLKKRKRQALRNQQFSKMLSRVVNETKERPRSAIAESIFEAVRAHGPFHAVYVSTDGFQRSAACKFLQARDVPCDWGLDLEEKPLAGARVTLFGIGRTDAAAHTPISSGDLTRLKKFWTKTLKSAGAREVQLRINLGAADVTTR